MDSRAAQSHSPWSRLPARPGARLNILSNTHVVVKLRAQWPKRWRSWMLVLNTES
jgi:hypothetical protein